jgi:hypothetical protein
MGASAMYLGGVFELIKSCVFDDKKHKNVNILLVGRIEEQASEEFTRCVEYVLAYGLNDMCFWAENERKSFMEALELVKSKKFDPANPPLVLAVGESKFNRVGRPVLSSFLPALEILKKLSNRANLMTCNMSVILKR